MFMTVSVELLMCVVLFAGHAMLWDYADFAFVLLSQPANK